MEPEIPVETEEERQRKLEEAELDQKQKTLFFLENWEPNKSDRDLVHLKKMYPKKSIPYAKVLSTI